MKMEKWVSWERLGNVSLKETAADVKTFLVEFMFMNDDETPTRAAFVRDMCRVRYVGDKPVYSWNKVRYLSLARDERRRLKRLSSLSQPCQP